MKITLLKSLVADFKQTFQFDYFFIKDSRLRNSEARFVEVEYKFKARNLYDEIQNTKKFRLFKAKVTE